MQVSKFLERIMRRRKILLHERSQTATLTYLGEQLGHLSFVGEHDIVEGATVYFNYTVR